LPGLFDDSDIERVRHAIDIADVIGGYVNLKRKAQGDWWGVCPFHGEKTPSFHVRSDRGMFHCFGCGKGGNVFTFLMEMEGVSFAEAVRTIADRAGVPLPEKMFSPEAQKQRSERDKLYQANSFAVNWFHTRLIGGSSNLRSPEAERALEYLTRRGINLDIICRFQIGWAETSEDALVAAAAAANIGGHTLAQAGLALRHRDREGFQDRFRSRIVFPIHNLSGKPVAFGARRVDGITPAEDDAKYINTSETAIYNKGETLYGLHLAREEIRRSGYACLVEGYTDLLALIQAGIGNSVASLGTSFTPMQAQLLHRFTNRINVVYDNDSAGITAGMRAADILTMSGLEVHLIRLPNGEDPDTLLQKGGAEMLRQTLEQQISFVKFRIETAGITQSLSQTDRIAAARDLLDIIRVCNDRNPTQAELLIWELAELTGIRREALDRALSGVKQRSLDIPTATPKPGLSVSPDQIAERELLHALIGHRELRAECLEEIGADQITHPTLRQLFILIERAHLRGESLDPAALPDQFNDPAVRSFVAEATLSGSDTLLEDARNEVRGCISLLRQRELQRRIADLEDRIRATPSDGKSYSTLKRELSDMKKQLHDSSR
jgi:DNA primase